MMRSAPTFVRPTTLCLGLAGLTTAVGVSMAAAAALERAQAPLDRGLMTAAAVALAGVIGWVGLMVPHMARLLTGPRFDRLLPAALVIGAGFMVLVDTAARSVALMEVPLGILTAVIGAPVFVLLLTRGARAWAT